MTNQNRSVILKSQRNKKTKNLTKRYKEKRLGIPFFREQTIFIERDEKSSIEEWKKREKEDVLKIRDFRKEKNLR